MSSSPFALRPTGLPVEAARADIEAGVAGGALVLRAEPGAGKSSLVPLFVADALAAAGRSGTVVVTEPRRLAARATATRLAELVGEPVGRSVGLTMRGEHTVGAATRIEVMTEAVLTNRLQHDPELTGVAAIVFDEFHERNLHSDLGLAMALEARAALRPDLVVVVMSATLEGDRVAALVGVEGVVDVPGRTFPVETRYLPRPSRDGFAAVVADTTATALRACGGDVLVFVPGRREIDDVLGVLTRAGVAGPGLAVEAIGLHGTTPVDRQRSVLVGGGGRRRVIVATAVAETSITVPGVEAVVDGGLARRARFDPATGLGRLETGYVTRFGADQRRGRAGRLGPGVCYRLWSAEDERHLDPSAPPEIVDGDPLPVAFELARWGDPWARDLPLLDHPGRERLEAAHRLLDLLGLAEPGGRLTDRGRVASALGLHPRLAALVLTARDLNRTGLGLRVASLLDDDQRPPGPDLATELEARWPTLADPADRLARRLRLAPDNRGSTDADHRPAGPANRPADGHGRSRPGTGITAGPGRSASDSRPADGHRARGRQGRNEAGDLGPVLARAWPDRVAMARSGRPGRFLLSTGREVAVAAGHPLAGAPFLVVADADGDARAAAVRRAVAVDRPTVLAASTDRITWVDEVAWDQRSDTLRAERQQRLGQIVLHREPLPHPPPEAVTRALVAGIRSAGLGLLNWGEEGAELRARLAWLHSEDPVGWPDLSDTVLLDRLEEWLEVSRCRSLADLRRLDPARALLGLLPWDRRPALDQLAPPSLTPPGGRAQPIRYGSGRPVWAVRLQHLFGLDDHPRVGPNQVPVTIEVLSPANRPAQVTTDLPGFWRGSYTAVRAELRGRYPRHPWPDDPLNPGPDRRRG